MAGAWVLALLLPVVVRVGGLPTRVTGDVAVIQLRSLEVWSGDPPLEGAFSRFGWSHPGPVLFYALSVPLRLFGSDARALALSAALVNGVSLAVIAVIVRHQRTTLRCVVIVAASLLLIGLGRDAVTDPWNVSMAMLPFFAAALGLGLSMSSDAGTTFALGLVMWIVTFQAHVGTGIALLPCVLIAGANQMRTARRRGRGLRLNRQGRRVRAVVFLLVLPLLIDAVTNPPGNLAQIVGWSVAGDEPRSGFGMASELVRRATSLSFVTEPSFSAPFFTIDEVRPGIGGGVLLVLLAGCTWLANRRRWEVEAFLCVSLLVAWAGGLLAASQIVRPVEFWQVTWMQPLAWLSWASVVAVAARWCTTRDVSRLVALATVVAIAAASLVVAGHAAGPSQVAQFEAQTIDIVADRLDSSSGLIRLDAAGDFASVAMLAGVIVELARRGIDVCVPKVRSFVYGEHRTCANRAVAEAFTIRIGAEPLPPIDPACVEVERLQLIGGSRLRVVRDNCAGS